MLTMPDCVSGSPAAAAGLKATSTSEQSPAQSLGRSVQQTEPACLLNNVPVASVVPATERRVVRGQVSDLQQQSLQLVARLEERQLLLPRESAALREAVLNNETVIDPQECRFAKSIDALRLFAAFLGIMEKSPALKRTLGAMIKDTPVSQSSLENTVAQGMFGGSTEEMKKALEDLKSILARFVQLNSDCSQKVPIAHNVREEILGMLDQCWEKYNLAIGNQAFYPFAKPDAECSVVKYWEHLTSMIDLLEQVSGYTDLHERIDKLDVSKVITPTTEFMALLHFLGCLRIPEVPSLDAMDIDRLFSVDKIFGHAYYQAKIFRSSCEWVEERIFPPLKLADGGFLLNQLWVNYLNACHIELEFFPFHDHIKKLASPWIDKTMARKLDRMIGHLERNDDSNTKFVAYYPARMITETGVSLRRDILMLYGTILKLNRPGEEFGSKHFAYADKAVNGCQAEMVTMEDMDWLMSLVQRGGLAYDWLDSRRGDRKLQCPECGFYGVLNEHEDPLDFFDDDYMDSSSGQPRTPLVDSPDVRSIQHMHRDLMRILWFHQQKKPDCSIARAVDVQKIWNEKYKGSCLMPAHEWLQHNTLTP